MKLNKERFCEIMDELRKANDADMKIEEARSICKSEYLGSDISFLSKEVIDLLSLVMGVSDWPIVSFCYELDFGRSEISSSFDFDEKNENGEWETKVYDWSSAEKFYDYLVSIAEE